MQVELSVFLMFRSVQDKVNGSVRRAANSNLPIVLCSSDFLLRVGRYTAVEYYEALPHNLSFVFLDVSGMTEYRRTLGIN